MIEYRSDQKGTMDEDEISHFQACYAAACEKYGVDQKPSVYAALSKHAIDESLVLELHLEDMEEADALAIADFLTQAEILDWRAIDIKLICEHPCTWKASTLLNLFNAPGSKLRHLDLSKSHCSRECVREISRSGLHCETLNFSHCSAKKLKMGGVFSYLQTLTVDNSSSITSLSDICFRAMPKLSKLSMCGTSILNLWTTSYGLSKLPSLQELRFQRCQCCEGTGHCSSREVGPSSDFQARKTAWTEAGLESDSSLEDSGDRSSDEDLQSEEEPAHNFTVSDHQAQLVEEQLVDIVIDDDRHQRLPSNRTGDLEPDNKRQEPADICQSSICCEKHYREFMIASLPRLKVLDNLEISPAERDISWRVYIEHFEFLPNNRRHKENVVEILKRRERGDRGVALQPHKSRRIGNVVHDQSRAGFSRTLCASKMSSCVWPATRTVYNSHKSSSEFGRKFRPRQFEYHPTEPSLMVVGTLHGEVAVVNHEDDKMVGYVESLCSPHSILGLCWLNKDPDKLIAGSDNGILQLYDVSRMRATTMSPAAGSSSSRPNDRRNPALYTYDEFEQLTSVHINSTDDYFLASGYSKHVGLYDLCTGKRLKIYPDLHKEHINVVKFSHHSPSLFATSSFDRDIKMWDLRTEMDKPIYAATSARGNVMVCFSCDDHYLLSSAVDNEVRQYLAIDGRLHMKFDIPPTNSRHNYTRSYYMNGRDYIITGSCEENVVRICCARTGRRLRDLTMEGRGVKNSLYVQSLRGDPFKDFHFCVLVAYTHPHSKSEIVKVNMLATDKQSLGPEPHSSYVRGSGA